MKAPSADTLLKKKLKSLGGTSRAIHAVANSPKKVFVASHDVTVVDETKASRVAEFKIPPPSRKRKLTLEFLDGYGTADAPPYEPWPEVDRLWVLASRER